jgi:hypothetical protein
MSEASTHASPGKIDADLDFLGSLSTISKPASLLSKTTSQASSQATSQADLQIYDDFDSLFEGLSSQTAVSTTTSVSTTSTSFPTTAPVVTTPIKEINDVANNSSKEQEYLGFSKAAVDFLKSLPDLSFMLTK